MARKIEAKESTPAPEIPVIQETEQVTDAPDQNESELESEKTADPSQGAPAGAPGDPPTPKVPEAPPVQVKERERMEGPKCYNCKSTNTFVSRTPPRTHPSFLRVRYYKCGNCGENFKA